MALNLLQRLTRWVHRVPLAWFVLRTAWRIEPLPKSTQPLDFDKLALQLQDIPNDPSLDAIQWLESVLADCNVVNSLEGLLQESTISDLCNALAQNNTDYFDTLKKRLWVLVNA